MNRTPELDALCGNVVLDRQMRWFGTVRFKTAVSLSRKASAWLREDSYIVSLDKYPLNGGGSLYYPKRHIPLKQVVSTFPIRLVERLTQPLKYDDKYRRL